MNHKSVCYIGIFCIIGWLMTLAGCVLLKIRKEAKARDEQHQQLEAEDTWNVYRYSIVDGDSNYYFSDCYSFQYRPATFNSTVNGSVLSFDVDTALNGHRFTVKKAFADCKPIYPLISAVKQAFLTKTDHAPGSTGTKGGINVKVSGNGFRVSFVVAPGTPTYTYLQEQLTATRKEQYLRLKSPPPL